MTHSLLHSLVIARAMSVEPIARLLCPDPLGFAVRPFVRSQDRWRTTATRAAFTNPHPHNLEKPR
jgi:hypothetical protein